MRKSLTIGIAVLLLGSSAALAQYQGDNRGGEQQHGYNEYQAPATNTYEDRRGYEGRRDFDQNRQAYDTPDTPHWSRGDRLPHDFAENNHVSDWQSRHLRRPPRGYHWVRSGNDYALAALATGVISQIVRASR
jgi:Ni/Co efflux regulator RcnB